MTNLPQGLEGINCFPVQFSAPPSVTRVTAVLAHSSGELLLLGTEGGHVFIVEVPGFRELEERNISLDQMASRSAKYNTNIISNVLLSIFQKA